MTLIAVTSSDLEEAAPYVASIEKRGGPARVLTPDAFTGVDAALDGVSGLMLTGGEDIHPRYYGQEIDPTAHVHPSIERDEMEMAVFRAALERNMPILGICRGMQLINVAFGGTLIQDMPGHRNPDDLDHPITHQVYVSPGSKLGAIMGLGAVFKTNSWHHQGAREPQRAPGLLASAYHPQDGVIEGLESPQHKWLIGVQCHIEREDEVAKVFLKLFEWLVAWSKAYEAGEMDG